MAGDESEVSFIDAEARAGGKEKITFREIVLNYVKKIGNFASVEFRGGFWEEKSHPDPQRNDPLKTYISDTREIYSNAVEFLYDVLFPHFDKKMKDEGKELVDELEGVYKDNTIIKEQDREDETPEEGEEVERKEKRSFGNVDNRLSYRKERIKINRKLFRSLCCFLKRKDYFKGQSLDEVE